MKATGPRVTLNGALGDAQRFSRFFLGMARADITRPDSPTSGGASRAVLGGSQDERWISRPEFSSQSIAQE